MNTRPFRFGACLLDVVSRSSWRSRACMVEDLGYDVLQVGDHLGMAAPFPALVAAADVTSIRLGTYVLNGGVYSPAYLARDVADVQRLTAGRLELGLGAGYAPAEFEAANVPLGTGGERLRRLAATLGATRTLLEAQAGELLPPIMLSGTGERMLRLAGREADIFSFSIMAGVTAGLGPQDAFARRVRVLREAAAGRAADLELNLFVAAVGESAEKVDLGIIRKATGLDADQLNQLPGVLLGSPREIADRLLRYREEYGVSYISVLEPHMAAFAKVVKYLR